MMQKPWRSSVRQNKNIHDDLIKNGIKVLAQDNLFILKRLLEKESTYKKKNLENDYKRYQNYKSNICRYPAIDFTKTGNNTKAGPIVKSYDYSKLTQLPNIAKHKKKKSPAKKKNLDINKAELSQKYYREAEDKTKKKRKESIDKESSTTSKNQEEDESGEGSGSGSGSGEGSGSGSGEGSGSGSGSGEGSGSGSGSGENSSSS